MLSNKVECSPCVRYLPALCEMCTEVKMRLYGINELFVSFYFFL